MKNIEDEICTGAWKCLCINVLFQAVHNMSCERKIYKPGSKYRQDNPSGVNKTGLNARALAKEWMAGGTGLVTFEDCCEAMGVESDRARVRIKEYCQQQRGRARK